MNNINIHKNNNTYTVNHYDGIHIAKQVTVKTPIPEPTTPEERIIDHIERFGITSAQLVGLDMDTMEATYLNTPPTLPADLPYYIRYMTEDVTVQAVQIYPEDQGVRYADVMGPVQIAQQRPVIERGLYLDICNQHETIPYRNAVYDSYDDTIILTSPIHPDSQVFMVNPIPLETACMMCLMEDDLVQQERMQYAIHHYLHDHPDEVNVALNAWHSDLGGDDWKLTEQLLLNTNTEVHQFIDCTLPDELQYLIKTAEDDKSREEVELYL